MSEIPTAEEFWLANRPMLSHAQIAIEFAKLHVEAALEEASQKAITKYETEYITDPGDKNLIGNYSKNLSIVIDKDSILNAYPESNII